MQNEIIDIVADYTKVPKSDIKSESRIIADLGLQSLDIYSLIGDFEEKYNIEIEDFEILDISTIAEMETLITKKINYHEEK